MRVAVPREQGVVQHEHRRQCIGPPTGVRKRRVVRDPQIASEPVNYPHEEDTVEITATMPLSPGPCFSSSVGLSNRSNGVEDCHAHLLARGQECRGPGAGSGLFHLPRLRVCRSESTRVKCSLSESSSG